METVSLIDVQSFFLAELRNGSLVFIQELERAVLVIGEDFSVHHVVGKPQEELSDGLDGIFFHNACCFSVCTDASGQTGIRLTLCPRTTSVKIHNEKQY